MRHSTMTSKGQKGEGWEREIEEKRRAFRKSVFHEMADLAKEGAHASDRSAWVNFTARNINVVCLINAPQKGLWRDHHKLFFVMLLRRNICVHKITPAGIRPWFINRNIIIMVIG